MIARDKGRNSLSASVKVTVNVKDLNDNSPEIKFESLDSPEQNVPPVMTIDEHCPAGMFVAHLSVSDADSGMNGRVRCSMASAQFRLEEMYDFEWKIVTANTTIDREYLENYRLIVTCNDMGKPILSSSIVVIVVINDVNDHSPVFNQTNYNFAVQENSRPNTVIGHVFALDQDKVSLISLVFSVMNHTLLYYAIEDNLGNKLVAYYRKLIG